MMFVSATQILSLELATLLLSCNSITLGSAQRSGGGGGLGGGGTGTGGTGGVPSPRVGASPSPIAGGSGSSGSGSSSSASTNACPRGNGQIVQLRSVTSTEYTVFFSGCPFYSPFNQTTPNTPTFQNKTITFRKTPVVASTVTYVGRYASGTTSNSLMIMSAIGYTVTGIGIYNEADAQGADAYIQESQTFDNCRGHSDQTGMYHFHTEPANGCVYNQTAGQHSPLLGIMLDNIPIYGALGDNGVPPSNLDECGGHTDSTYSFYHYHTTYNLQAPYVIKCFRGCIFNANGNPVLQRNPSLVKTDATCVRAATQYDYSSFVNPFTSLSVTPGGSPTSTPTSTPSPLTSKQPMTSPTARPTGSMPTARPVSAPTGKPGKVGRRLHGFMK